MNQDFFSWYQDGNTLNLIFKILNCGNYFLNIFLLTVLLTVALGSLGFVKRNYFEYFKLSKIFFNIFTIPILVATIALWINDKFGFYLTYAGFLIYAVFIIILLNINMKRKSLKWITTLLLCFIMFVLGIYLKALDIVTHTHYSIMENFDISQYNTVVKPFFSIYESGDIILKVNYFANGHWMSFNNDVVYKRVYLFYYFFNSVAVLFWFTVYWQVLKMHKIKIMN